MVQSVRLFGHYRLMGVKARERLRDYLRENVRSPIPDT